jgi:hypothetical protein
MKDTLMCRLDYKTFDVLVLMDERKYDYNIHELWDMIKKLNLRTHRTEEGAEI